MITSVESAAPSLPGQGVCPGFCCAAFHIARDVADDLFADPESYRDGLFLVEMLIPLEPEEAQRRHRELMRLHGWIPDEGEPYFTCRHWDPETRLCTIYEQRPQMCRDYGVATPCCHGCGMGT